MHTISRDTPCYYLTSVAKDRLHIFRTDIIKAKLVLLSMKRASQAALLSMLT